MRLVRFCLLFCLLSILPAYASVPSAVRTLQSGEVDFESVIRVDVAVSFDDGDLPTAWSDIAVAVPGQWEVGPAHPPGAREASAGSSATQARETWWSQARLSTT